MAMVGHRRQLEVEETGQKCTVPANDKARLMYYLNCMSTVLDLDSEDGLSRLTSYNNYFLSDNETLALLALCVALNPVELTGKCIFAVDDDDMNDNNTFLKLSSNEVNFVVSSSVLIGGSQKRVAKIMLYKRRWIQTFYFGPIQRITEKSRSPSHITNHLPTLQKGIKEQQRREEEAERRRRALEAERQESSTCTIL